VDDRLLLLVQQRDHPALNADEAVDAVFDVVKESHYSKLTVVVKF